MAFYTRELKEIFTGAVNALNGLPFPLTSDMFNITNPQPLTVSVINGVDVSGYNTVGTITATGKQTTTGESYGKTVDVYYNRLDLSVLFRGVDVAWATTSTSTAAFAAWLTETYGIPMTVNDLVDVPLSGVTPNSYVEIEAAADSPWFVGSVMVHYTLEAASPSVVPESLQFTVATTGPSVDLNYAQSYPRDYTGNGTVLRKGIDAATAADRAAVWSVLFGTRASEWKKGMVGVLYNGTESVVSAGGRAGFQYLLIVPQLNAWAHFND